MNLKGDLNVKRTGIFDRRADQGLNAQSITEALSLVRHSCRWQDLDATAESGEDSVDVILPDATTLPKGWEVVVNAKGDPLTVKDNGGTLKATIIAEDAGAVLFTLLDNGTSNGVWYQTALDLGGDVATRYTEAHDATTDWGSASGGYYTITILASTHGRGTTPKPQFFESDGGTGFDEVAPDKVNIASNGDIAFRVPDDPDLRYAGRIIVM